MEHSGHLPQFEVGFVNKIKASIKGHLLREQGVGSSDVSEAEGSEAKEHRDDFDA